jgi:NAD(P)H-hydrate epimerase
MGKVLTAAEMKALDARTIEEMGVPSMVLMERAALAAVDVFYEKGFNSAKVLCVCGAGNNGGDGFAVARLLHLKGIDADALFIGDADKMSVETQRQMNIARNYGTPIFHNALSALKPEYTAIIDALFGIGGDRLLTGMYFDAVEMQNALPAEILSLDIPSGISADTGRVLGTAIRAKATVTFAYSKVGLTVPPGRDYAGDVVVKDIGIYAQ